MSGRFSLYAGVEAPARQRGREQEGSEENVLAFYRGICTCAGHVHVRAVRAMRAAHLDKSALASPCLLCAQALSCRLECWFFQRPGRDDNSNVETKTICSGLLHTLTQFGVICKLSEGALDRFIQITDKDVK